MFMDMDKNQDNKLTKDEWLSFFQRAIPTELSDSEFAEFFDSMRATVLISRQPIKWTPTMRGFYFVLLVCQVVRKHPMLVRA